MVKNSKEKKSIGKNGTGTIGIDQFDVDLTKWNWVELELTKWSATLISLIHLIAFILNNNYIWLVSWENSQTGISSQDPPRILWFGLLIIDVSNGLIDSIVHVCERRESLLWLLNKIYLQIISVITELEKKKVWETNIKYYLTFMIVIYLNILIPI